MGCAQALLTATGRNAHEIMGSPDDLKLRSSMTLFRAVAGPGTALSTLNLQLSTPFQSVLDRYYASQPDERTLEIMAGWSQ